MPRQLKRIWPFFSLVVRHSAVVLFCAQFRIPAAEEIEKGIWIRMTPFEATADHTVVSFTCVYRPIPQSKTIPRVSME